MLMRKRCAQSCINLIFHCYITITYILSFFAYIYIFILLYSYSALRRRSLGVNIWVT